MKSIEQIQNEITRLRGLETALRSETAERRNKGFLSTQVLARYQAKIEVLEWVLSEMP